jgi:hypothetical protein
MINEANNAVLLGADLDSEVVGAISEVSEAIWTALDDVGFKPMGTHRCNFDRSTEILAGIDKLEKLIADESVDAGIRAAAVPEVEKLRAEYAAGEFIKPLHDPDWGGDLMEFVMRIAPHDIIEGFTPAGLAVVRSVTIDIATLRGYHDDWGEISYWIYGED